MKVIDLIEPEYLTDEEYRLQQTLFYLSQKFKLEPQLLGERISLLAYLLAVVELCKTVSADSAAAKFTLTSPYKGLIGSKDSICKLYRDMKEFNLFIAPVLIKSRSKSYMESKMHLSAFLCGKLELMVKLVTCSNEEQPYWQEQVIVDAEKFYLDVAKQNNISSEQLLCRKTLELAELIRIEIEELDKKSKKSDAPKGVKSKKSKWL